MGKTDQAFIDAYRRRPPVSAETSIKSSKADPSEATTVASTGAASRLREVSASAPHGPHVRFGGGSKAPLSEVLNAREAGKRLQNGTPSSTSPAPAGLLASAATQLAHFSWPQAVDSLVQEETGAFDTVIEAIQEAWPVLGFVGCRPGSGGTTVALAISRLLSARGVPVAVIDADPAGPSLASQLGLKRHATIAGALSGGLPLSSAMIHAEDDGVSLLVAGPITQHPAMVDQVLQELHQAHPVVLIDLGANPRNLILRPDAVALVHPFDESDAVVEYSSRSLHQVGACLVGTVQTMTPAA